jgi:predicted RND superfamily exporter protein
MNTAKEIAAAIKVAGLALFWGGLSGIIGLMSVLCFSIGLLSCIGIFGGIGLLLVYFRLVILLPFIHCV